MYKQFPRFEFVCLRFLCHKIQTIDMGVKIQMVAMPLSTFFIDFIYHFIQPPPKHEHTASLISNRDGIGFDQEKESSQ